MQADGPKNEAKKLYGEPKEHKSSAKKSDGGSEDFNRRAEDIAAAEPLPPVEPLIVQAGITPVALSDDFKF